LIKWFERGEKVKRKAGKIEIIKTLFLNRVVGFSQPKAN